MLEEGFQDQCFGAKLKKKKHFRSNIVTMTIVFFCYIR